MCHIVYTCSNLELACWSNDFVWSNKSIILNIYLWYNFRSIFAIYVGLSFLSYCKIYWFNQCPNNLENIDCVKCYLKCNNNHYIYIFLIAWKISSLWIRKATYIEKSCFKFSLKELYYSLISIVIIFIQLHIQGPGFIGIYFSQN